jgi:hypothetical protein
MWRDIMADPDKRARWFIFAVLLPFFATLCCVSALALWWRRRTERSVARPSGQVSLL